MWIFFGYQYVSFVVDGSMWELTHVKQAGYEIGTPTLLSWRAIEVIHKHKTQQNTITEDLDIGAWCYPSLFWCYSAYDARDYECIEM